MTTASAPKLIGQALLEKGLITQDQLNYLLESQVQRNERLGETAVSLGLIKETAFAQFLAAFLDLPYVSLESEEEVDPSVIDMIPEQLARRYTMVVIGRKADALTVALADPLDVRAVDAVRLETKCRVNKTVSSREMILRAIDRSYHAPDRLAKSMDHLIKGEEVAALDQAVSIHEGREANALLEQLKHEASDAPVVQFVNLLLMRAIQERASDIHIEPEENAVSVRLRVDGKLREVAAPPKHMFRAIITRIKLLGTLDIAERRLPQDGRFNFKVFEKTIDVRLSSLPTAHGEKLVLRILDRGSLILDMQGLGFDQDTMKTFERVLHLPYGLAILTGPTGSGKTTTLYAALNSIKDPTKNIVTVEDPVEYRLSKINQVQMKAGIGLTFASALRSILRQDPDIIMVGEIRDRETAEICIRAALTGHLVLSTLHTNDAVSAISRLTDIGIESYLLTAALTLVMAQRLVRRTCEECAGPWEPPRELVQKLMRFNNSPKAWNFQRGKGCVRCGGSGYFGRVAIYEQFSISEKIKSLITKGGSAHELKLRAQEEGLRTLLQSALNKVAEGVTTVDEAFSVCATQTEMVE